jgi:hypothetical protein
VNVTVCRNRRDILAGSFAVRQSKTILARSVKRQRGATANDPFVIEHSNEALVEKETTAHSAKTHEWVKLGPNHFGDCTKVAMVLWRYFDQPRTYGGPNPAFIIYTRKQQTHEL